VLLWFLFRDGELYCFCRCFLSLWGAVVVVLMNAVFLLLFIVSLVGGAHLKVLEGWLLNEWMWE